MLTCHARCTLILAPLLLGMVGCESFRTPIETFVTGRRPDNDKEVANEHREKFRSEGSADGIRWLLVNRVRQGMSVDDVAREIGLPGEQLFDVPWRDSGGTRFQVTDEIYQWGPDAEGHSYPLAFRDGLLVNYNPADYR